MGQVAIIYRIMPEGADIDIRELGEKVKDAAKGIAQLQGMQEKPIAFGVTALLARVVIEDKEGGPEEIEKAISAVQGVQSVEVIEMSRLL